MKQLRSITVDRVMSWSPCPDWKRKRVVDAFGGRKSMTPLEVLSLENVEPQDRLWVVLREEIIPTRELRLIACWCAKRALDRERSAGREPDPRSWDAVRVARRHAHGQATVEELVAAWDASWDAARDAAGAAARGAAGDAAGDAAECEKILAHVRRVLRRLEVEA